MDACGVDMGVIKLPVWQEWLDLEARSLVMGGNAARLFRLNG